MSSAPPRILGVIPARYASTRFPGKPLHLIAGKPLVQHVVEQCRKSRSLTDVIVATDDLRIARAVEPFATVAFTREDHPSGTDRIAEVASRLGADAYINVQGDEPLMDPEVIDAVAAQLGSAGMSTAATPIRHPEDLFNPNVVKVVIGVDGHALYFSRRTIPYLRDHADAPPAVQMATFPFQRHLGIYGYRRDVLLALVQIPPSPLELAEKLEQLRALEHGFRIAVARVNHEGIGVDHPADVARVEAILAGR
jgi:3-deoxy-manno-octulosonate cytidylyltransferase (CMP-KDO synthetase)